LPDPAPRRALCFARGLLADGVASIAEMVEDACDLVVAAKPGERLLRVAFDRLRPGGSLYTEWRCEPSAAARMLHASGFVDVACYRPWPSLDHARCWIPIDQPEALSHFISSHMPVRTNRPWRFLAAAAAAAWVFSARAGLGGRTCVIARKPGASASINELFPLLLTGGPRSTSKVVRLAFSPADCRPRNATKMARVPEASAGLKREADVLEAIDQRHGHISGMPRVLSVRDGADSFAVVETAVTGRPLYRFLRRDNYARLAFQAADWLAELAGRSERRPPAHWWPALVEPALQNFAASFGPVVRLSSLERSRHVLERLGSLPRVCEQRDFSPWNVLLTPDGRIGVLDWESAELNGLPGMDLVYFLAYLAFYRDGALNMFRRGYETAPSFRRSYRRLIRGHLFRDVLKHYAMNLGLEPDELDPIRLLVWLIHSRSDYLRFSADGAETPSAKKLRRSLFLALWEEELAIQG
jgi:hypothetical protein